MKISRKTALGILLTILILLAGILLRSFLQENLVKPIALLLWVMRRVFDSVDQVVYWVGLIMGGLFLAILRLAPQPMDIETVRHSSGNATLKNMNQWRTLMMLTRDETDRPNLLRQNLTSLLKDLYASKQPNLVPWEVYAALERGDIPLPEATRAFLMIGQNPNARPSLRQRFVSISRLPGKWLRHWTGQDVADYYSSIADVISLMEKSLESENDE